MMIATQTTQQAATRSEALYRAAGQAVMHVLFKHRIDEAGSGGVLYDDKIPVNYTPFVFLEKQRLKNKFARNLMAEAAGFWALSLFLREQNKQLGETETTLDTFVRVAQGEGNYNLGSSELTALYEQLGEFQSVGQGNCLVSFTKKMAILVREAQVILKDPAVQKAVRAVAELLLNQGSATGSEISDLCAAQPGFQQVQKQLYRFRATVKVDNSEQARIYLLVNLVNASRAVTKPLLKSDGGIDK